MVIVEAHRVPGWSKRPVEEKDRTVHHKNDSEGQLDEHLMGATAALEHRAPFERNHDALFFHVAVVGSGLVGWHWPSVLYGWIDTFAELASGILCGRFFCSHYNNGCHDHNGDRSKLDSDSEYNGKGEQ